MKKDVYRLVGIAAVLIVGLGLGASFYFRAEKTQQEEKAAKQPPVSPLIFVRPHSHTLGPADAKVTVVEFLDPECESCRAMYPMVKDILRQYTGRVRLVIRYMPFHGNSLTAIAALEAAAEQNRYWELLEMLFLNQPRWGSHHDPKPELIPELAKEVGLDMEAFGRSVTKTAHREVAETDRADGKSLGVTGTPTFFVNGRLLTQLGYEPLKQLIDEELAR